MTDKSKEKLLAEYLEQDPAEFIPLLVHDLRGPLTGILSASKLLKVFLAEPVNNPEQVLELADILIRSTDNMRTVLDVAITYDKIQRGIPDED